jgi:hypothetical protein
MQKTFLPLLSNRNPENGDTHIPKSTGSHGDPHVFWVHTFGQSHLLISVEIRVIPAARRQDDCPGVEGQNGLAPAGNAMPGCRKPAE